jgi:hypothetical protein
MVLRFRYLGTDKYIVLSYEKFDGKHVVDKDLE